MAMPFINKNITEKQRNKWTAKLSILCYIIEQGERGDIEAFRKELSEERLVAIPFTDTSATPSGGAQIRIFPSYTLLSFAAKHCNLRVMTVLLDEFNANPNEEDAFSISPLHHLVEADRGDYGNETSAYKAAELLIARGANPDKKPSVGVHGSARSWAEENAPSVLTLMQNGMKDTSAGANCREVFSRKDSALMTFSYQVRRNAEPLAAAAGVAAAAGAALVASRLKL